MKHNVEYFKKYYVNATKEEVIEDMFLDCCEQAKEIERLHSIIKEVREYIEEKYDYILGDDTFLDHDERIERKQIDHILEILDNEEVKLKKVKEK